MLTKYNLDFFCYITLVNAGLCILVSRSVHARAVRNTEIFRANGREILFGPSAVIPSPEPTSISGLSNEAAETPSSPARDSHVDFHRDAKGARTLGAMETTLGESGASWSGALTLLIEVFNLLLHRAMVLICDVLMVRMGRLRTASRFGDKSLLSSLGYVATCLLNSLIVVPLSAPDIKRVRTADRANELVLKTGYLQV
ncbi:hypothetical protein BaRGS_00013789 [Batillaria attramentaria]|uniref:Uncharacterized protein n=1 Tax=Batillaria attramentaria TaxID=370345 RepID=A0ABD0L6A3_9CAEN